MHAIPGQPGTPNATWATTSPLSSSRRSAAAATTPTPVALQPDGKIVVAGYCSNGTNNDFCLTRYESGPFDAKNCSLHIDGDGRTLATTDMLIGTRIALGITGDALIGGITFAANAWRNTWPLIRNYLGTQCGLSLVR